MEHGKDELVFNSLHTDPISEWMNGCWYKAARPTLQASWGLVPRHRHLTEKGRRPPLTSRLPALFCQWHIELKFQSCKSEAHNAETANGFSDRWLGGFFDPSIRTGWTLLRMFFEATSTDTRGRQVLLRLQISLGRDVSS